MKITTLFGPGTGGPADFYRIPSVITTDSGVTVACADARFCSGRDNPNRIDKVIRRSEDCGETWGDYITAVEEHGTEHTKSSAAIDPVMVYVPEKKRILMVYSHTPAGTGILNSVCGTGFDKDGNKLLSGRFGTYILKGEKVFRSNGRETPYTVKENGDIFKNSQSCGNIYTGGKLKETHTSFLMICHSDDDGLTWSKPRCLNTQVKKDFMSFIGPGPGCGIVIEKGAYKGRVVIPVYFGSRAFPLQLSCTVIYSDDCGESWTLGETPNNTRNIRGKKANCKKIRQSEMLTESQLIEQEDGTLKYFIRNHDKRRSAAVAYSRNGGESWEDFKWDDSLPQPICQMSVIKLKGTEKPTVVFLNPADRQNRANGTVRLSEDDGETFKWQRLLKEGGFVYSAMTQLPNGRIGVLFEPDTECREIHFTSFTADWIKGGDE